MQSIAIVACLLAYFVAANPVDIEPRSLASQSYAQTQASQSTTTTGFGIGGGLGVGGFNGGMSAYSAQSSTYSSYSAVTNSFSSLCSQISNIQSMMYQSSFSQSIAMQYMSRLAVSMQSALSQSVGCGCFGQGNVLSYVNSMFSQFSSMMMSMQSMFGSSCGQILQPFGGISQHFSQFFESWANAGYSVNGLIAPSVAPIFGRVVPGFTPFAHK